MKQVENTFADKVPGDLSWLARWASIAVRDQLAEIQNDVPVLVRTPFQVRLHTCY